MKISVVIPVFNAEVWLYQTIESALSQSYPPHEVIVIDDGSTDRSGEVAQSFGRRIRFMRQTNAGTAATRNRGAALATGDWIALLDHDDYFLPEKLMEQKRLAESDGRIRLVYSATRQILPDGRTRDVFFPPSVLWPTLQYRSCILPSTMLIRRDALLETRFDAAFQPVEDWDFLLRFLRRYSVASFGAVSEPLTVYRVLPSSESNRDVLRQFQAEMKLLERLLEGHSRIRRGVLRRQLTAHFNYDTSIMLRQQDNPQCLRFMLQSLFSWPAPSRYVLPWQRYKVALHMLLFGWRGMRRTPNG